MTYSRHLLRQLRSIIGHNIHRYRLRKKMSLVKLSRLTGVPEHALDRYELGRGEATLQDLLRIACVMGVEFDGLVKK